MTTASTTLTVDGVTFTITVSSAPAVTSGVQAARIADLLEGFGVNTFSSLDPNANVWGAWPADYSAPTVIAALNWLTASSGLTLRIREYHYAGRTAMQNAWLPQVTAATGAKVSLCVGSNGDAADVPTMLAMAATAANNIGWLEGLNEPNNDFGSGPVSPAAMQATQTLLNPLKPGGPVIVGPSIVFGLPNPEGYITPPYVSAAQVTALNASMTLANGHFYPPRNPDLDDGSNRGGSFDDVVVGLRSVYGKPLTITEWHPTLYNADGHSGDLALAAYLTPIALLSAFRLGVSGMFWYSLFDYGWDTTTNAPIYASGLFPKNATNPRPAAYAIRAMYLLTGDKGATKHSFTPGKLDYHVAGLPPPVNAASPHTGGQHALFQASDGRFFLFLWNSQPAPGGSKVPVTVSFATPVAAVAEYHLTKGDASSLIALQTLTHAAALTSQLDGSVRLLVINP